MKVFLHLGILALKVQTHFGKEVILTFRFYEAV